MVVVVGFQRKAVDPSALYVPSSREESLGMNPCSTALGQRFSSQTLNSHHSMTSNL